MRGGRRAGNRVTEGSAIPNPHSAIPNPREWGLYLVTDRAQTHGRNLLDVVDRALAGGVRAVQLREKDLPTLDLYRLAEKLLPRTQAAGAALLINDRVDVALALGADGVHLTRRSLPPAEARALLGPSRILGISCHAVAEVEEAAAGGADFVVLGPIFETPSKRPYGPPLGTSLLREARTRTALPLVAIGGISPGRVPEVMAAGAHGVAVISAVIAAPDPAAAARELLAAVAASRRGD